jgi:hypothetical protein
MARLVMIARLRDGAYERALELAATSKVPPSSGFDQFGVYLSESEAIFLLEAPDVEDRVRRILDNPALATELSPWLPLFDGALHRAPEVHHWSRVPRT